MKTLEQLGISPAPWKVCDGRSLGGDVIGIECEDKPAHLVAGDVILKEADAQIMSAAPELYRGLREAVVEVCHDCPYCGVRPDYRCSNRNCLGLAALWRAALAKAAGEIGAKEREPQDKRQSRTSRPR